MAAQDKPRRVRARSSGKTKVGDCISLNEAENIVGIICLTQTCPDFSFDVWIDDDKSTIKVEGRARLSKAGWKAVEESGFDQNQAKLAFYKFTFPAAEYIRVITTTSLPNVPSLASLKCVLLDVFNCHSFIKDTGLAPDQQTCHVHTEGTKCKNGASLSVIEMRTHIFNRNANAPMVVNAQPSRFVLCEHHSNLAFSLWYLLSVKYLVENEYVQWSNARKQGGSRHDFVKECAPFVASVQQKINECYAVVVKERDAFDATVKARTAPAEHKQ